MRHTVLVIDDQWSMQELARIVLHAAGYEVLLAGDGPTGLCLARTAHPDVTVLDLHMPGMDGLDVLRGLHQDNRTATIPVILITTEATEEQASAGLRAGASSYLRKPFHPPDLLSVIEKVLDRQEMPMAV